MQIAAGLVERPERTLPRTNKTSGHGRAKGESSVEKKRTGVFNAVLKDLVKATKDKGEDSPVIPENLWAQLVLLFPQLASANISEETISGAGEQIIAGLEEGTPLTELTGLMAETDGTGEAAVLEEAFAENLEALVETMAQTGNSEGLTGGTPITQPTTEPKESLEQSPSVPFASLPESLPVEDVETTDPRSVPDRLEESQAGSFVNSTGPLPQPTKTAAEEDGLELVSDDAKGQSLRKARTAAEKVDGNLDFRSTMESGDEKAFTTIGVETKTTARQFGERLESHFNLVEGVNHPAQQGTEIVDLKPEATNPPVTSKAELTTQIISNAKLMVKNGLTKIQIQLEPAELGKLELSLVLERDLVAARFVTETQGVQSLIEANLPELRASLEEAGLTVDLLQVGVQTGTNSQMQNETNNGGDQFRRNSGWTSSAELFVQEERIFADEAWHGMVNLRI